MIRDELKMILKEAVLALSWMAEEIHEIPQSGMPVSRPEFEPRISFIQV